MAAKVKIEIRKQHLKKLDGKELAELAAETVKVALAPRDVGPERGCQIISLALQSLMSDIVNELTFKDREGLDSTTLEGE